MRRRKLPGKETFEKLWSKPVFCQESREQACEKGQEGQRLAAAKEEERNRQAEASICPHPVIKCLLLSAPGSVGGIGTRALE